MTNSQNIVCKPTPWFWSRAFGMLAMFLFLGGWFYKDAHSGYRKKNLAFLMKKGFEKAEQDLLAHTNSKKPEADWPAFAATQTITLGDDSSILPPGTPNPSPWPEELHDVTLLKQGGNAAWEKFRTRMKMNKPGEKLHEAGAIREQWYFAYGLTACAAYTLFILLRTSRRKISADATSITTQDGRTVPFSSLYELDLRKWANKGLAFGKYKNPDGNSGTIRIDGMTYGGFKVEQNEPAEQLLRRIKENFQGEIIDYEPTDAVADSAPTDAVSTESEKNP